jgi:hypothetical protein
VDIRPDRNATNDCLRCIDCTGAEPHSPRCSTTGRSTSGLRRSRLPGRAPQDPPPDANGGPVP